MKFNFFKSKKSKIADTSSKSDIDEFGFTQSELIEYDKHVMFYYTNIINSIVLFTYTSIKLDGMRDTLIDPLTELYEELQYAFTSVCFETVFRNKFIDLKYKQELLEFKSKVEKIPNEIWAWEFLDENEIWKSIRFDAETLLEKLERSSRNYDEGFTTVIKFEN